MFQNNKYIGHESQIYGVEEHQLIGGKGSGMRLFQVKNGKGLEFTVSADRCADISRLSFKGDNYGFFSASGYVAPSYYQEEGTGFLKSFTAGFLTTCGLTAVGTPCTDEGEQLALHGTIGNTPAERIYWDMDAEEIRINAVINDAGIFARKLRLSRQIVCSKNSNKIKIHDTVWNMGDDVSPLMILYHMNMGYPLLSEESLLYIPSSRILPRNEHSDEGIEEWDKIISPTAGFEEQCYFHQFDQEGIAAIYNKNIQKGLIIRFDKDKLDYFVEWKMMGQKDYVLGLEPGNCHPNGRHMMRGDGRLKFIRPDEEIQYCVELEIIESIEQWNSITAIQP